MTPITLELPDDLAQQLQQFDTETLSDLLRQLLRLYPDSPTDEPEPTIAIPLSVWQDIQSERETAYLLKSPVMRDRLLTAINREDGIPFPTIETLGDLLDQGYGLWADRDDIAEPVEYATHLRSEAWQRHR